MEDIKHDRMANVLRKALQNEFGVANDEDIEVYDINESPGSGVSDNFGGELKLVKFKFNIRNQQQGNPGKQEIRYPPQCPSTKNVAVNHLEPYKASSNISKEHSYFVKSLPKNQLVKDMLESVI